MLKSGILKYTLGVYIIVILQSAKSVNVNEAVVATKVTLVHKKIRLSEDLLAWEHEKFSLHKVPAATVSHHPSPHISHMTMFTKRSLLHYVLT